MGTAMFKVDPKGRGERGETQLGILIWAVVAGVCVSIVMTLQSCIQTYKDGKVTKRRQQYLSQFKRVSDERGVPGYTVRY